MLEIRPRHPILCETQWRTAQNASMHHAVSRPVPEGQSAKRIAVSLDNAAAWSGLGRRIGIFYVVERKPMLNDGHVPGRKPAIHDGFHRSIHTDLSNGGGSAGSCGKGPGGPSLDRTCPRVKRRTVYGHCCPLC